MQFIDGVDEISAEVLQEVTQSESPVYLTPQTAGGSVQMHQVAVSRRMGRHDWTLDLPPNSDLKMQEYCRAVLYYMSKNYRRNVRRRAAPQATSNEEVKLADGTALAPRGEDALSRDALSPLMLQRRRVTQPGH